MNARIINISFPMHIITRNVMYMINRQTYIIYPHESCIYAKQWQLHVRDSTVAQE